LFFIFVSFFFPSLFLGPHLLALIVVTLSYQPSRVGVVFGEVGLCAVVWGDVGMRGFVWCCYAFCGVAWV
jgi:hypothetical protein